MIILTTSASAQTLSVIPREYFESFTMSVRDDNTNVTQKYSITSASNSGNYLTFDNIFNPTLVKNRFYDLRLYIDSNFWDTSYSFWNLYEVKWDTNDGQIIDIYNDKIFCTDQDVDQLNQNDYYKINKDQYTFYNGSDNTYTVR